MEFATPSSDKKFLADIGPYRICGFCNLEFKSLVVKKLNCGSSVCEQCFSKIQYELTSSGKYDCLKYESKHEEPPNGFQDNEFIIGLLGLKQAEKTLSEPEEKLKRAVGKTQVLIFAIESDDYKGEAEKHFDKLEISVIDAVEDAIEHLKALELHYLKAIYERCETVLASNPPRDLTMTFYKHVNDLNLARQLVTEWKDYFFDFGRDSSEDKLTKALTDLDELNSRLEVAREHRQQELANWCGANLTLNSGRRHEPASARSSRDRQ